MHTSALCGLQVGSMGEAVTDLEKEKEESLCGRTLVRV
jgi:hypothetical protein